MNTRYIAEELRLSHWGGIMRSKHESGLTAKAFCKQEGIHENVYYYWQRKLREAACEQMCGLPVDAVSTQLAPAGFTEVTVAPAAAQPHRPAGTAARPSQIRLEAAGVKISTDSSYPLENLAALLRELRVGKDDAHLLRP
jgi:transposase-like protein